MGKRFVSLNMGGGDLRNQDLRDAVFESCNLGSANFAGSNLAGAEFRSCNLGGATFPASALSVATFRSCNMGGVRYVSVEMRQAAPVATPPEPKTWRNRPSQGTARPSFGEKP